MQIPSYSTRRLPGLNILPSDAKAMMRARAINTIGAKFSADCGERPRSSGGGTGGFAGKRGGLPASKASPHTLGVARGLVAAATAAV